MALNSGYRIKSRLWIEGENGTFLAEGRVALLKEIDSLGSINAAAKNMKMSYRKAWEMINAMNSEATEPLVVKVSGGKNGGGTVVTETGKSAIKAFEKLNKKCHAFLEKESKKLTL